MDSVPVRVQAAVYATGLFSSTQTVLVAVVLPLWLLHLNASPVMIGFALGSFNLLPFLFSVHGGALMDRLGPRRVMIAFAVMGAATPLLFPVLPFIWAVFVLQMIGGLASTMGWVGAQTLIGQLMKGSPRHAGRFTAICVLGNMVGPPLAGAGWDFIGPWGAFGVLFAWTALQLLAVFALPPAAGDHVAEPHGWLKARDLKPEIRSYTAAFRLLALPMVAFVVMLSMVRITGYSIQGSFYVVYLNGHGITGTAIGLLMATGAVAAAAGALGAAPLARMMHSSWLLVTTALLSVLAMAVTPLLGLYVLFLAAQVARGASAGMSTPLIISQLSHAVGPDQGKAVGLRTMMNRLTSTVTPMVMGALVAWVGLDGSFLVVGALIGAMTVFIVCFGRAKGLL
ncbi:MAG: MFS transporter [Alphaproteobacteria bacterium]|nr:MFS transporter [Alphaproteobacteria bacterium]